MIFSNLGRAPILAAIVAVGIVSTDAAMAASVPSGATTAEDTGGGGNTGGGSGGSGGGSTGGGSTGGGSTGGGSTGGGSTGGGSTGGGSTGSGSAGAGSVSREDTDLFDVPLIPRRKATRTPRTSKSRTVGRDGLPLVQNDDVCYDDKYEGCVDRN